VPVEGADVDLEIVAGVDHHDRLAGVVMALVEPALEGGRIHRRRAAQLRLDQRHAHGDDLFLDLHQHALVRLLFRQAFLDFDVGKARVAAQPGQVLVDIFAGPDRNMLMPSGVSRIVPAVSVPRRSPGSAGAFLRCRRR
jgi:hypothetical protein